MLQAWCWLLFDLFTHCLVKKKNHITLKYAIQIFPLKDHSCVFDICACRLHPTLCDTRRQFYLTGTSSTDFTYICVCLWFCFLYLWVCKLVGLIILKICIPWMNLKKNLIFIVHTLMTKFLTTFFVLFLQGPSSNPNFLSPRMRASSSYRSVTPSFDINNDSYWKVPELCNM